MYQARNCWGDQIPFCGSCGRFCPPRQAPCCENCDGKFWQPSAVADETPTNRFYEALKKGIASTEATDVTETVEKATGPENGDSLKEDAPQKDDKKSLSP